jgi:hypothetical protein
LYSFHEAWQVFVEITILSSLPRETSPSNATCQTFAFLPPIREFDGWLSRLMQNEAQVTGK